MAISRTTRRLAWIGVPVVLIGLLVAFWSWDWFIPIVESRASAAIGRTVTIPHLHLRLGRVVTVTADGVVVANPPGWPDTDPPLAAMRALTVQADAWAYIRGHGLVLPMIEIDAPTVVATETADGAANFRLSTGQRRRDDNEDWRPADHRRRRPCRDSEAESGFQRADRDPGRRRCRQARGRRQGHLCGAADHWPTGRRRAAVVARCPTSLAGGTEFGERADAGGSRRHVAGPDRVQRRRCAAEVQRPGHGAVGTSGRHPHSEDAGLPDRRQA